MATVFRKKLGEILLEANYIKPDQLQRALLAQKDSGKRLGAILVEQGVITDQNLIEVLEFQLGVPHVILAKRNITPEVLSMVPEPVAKKYNVFPVEMRGEKLVLAMIDPTDVFALDELKITLNRDIQPVIVSDDDLRKAFNQYYGVRSSVEEVFKDIEIVKDTEEEVDITKLKEMVEEAPIVRLVNLIITQAVRDKASDIHIEPWEGEVKVRYRIDGVLREVMTVPKNTQAAIISRIKIISNMNIAEKRVPQDGRIQMMVDNLAIDLRVSCLPVVFGEKIVMRILFKNTIQLKLEQLGFLEDTLSKFRSVYMQPHGIILVTGPTGSGKSTTLSAVLSELNSSDVNIMTVEDPVEYQIRGVNQVQVNTRAGLTFAAALRSFLRQDPDIIMVGEIRDGETARIATQAALTGHLVLTTLHTNDAPSSITRLIDMSIEPYMVGSTVIGIIAQRLVRGICNNCKEEYQLAPDDPVRLMIQPYLPPNVKPDQSLKLIKGRGCKMCNNTGYAKRVAVHEVMIMNKELIALTCKNVSADILRDAGIKSGMRTLMMDGLVKAIKGQTTIDEVIRIAYTGEQ
ncbi:MAG: GspE/PulE family protein [Bacillota bacterium]